MRIDSIDHSFVGDLKVESTSPDNSTTVRLIEHVGGPNNGGDDLVDTVFDDEAPTVIGSAGSAAPYTGSFRPQGDQLSRFDGKEQQGTWKLRVSDRYENDTGSLLGWSMTIRTAQCDPNVNAPETQIQAAPPSQVGSRQRELRVRLAAAERPVPVPPRRRRLHAVHLAPGVREPPGGRPHLRGARVRPVRQRGRQPGDLQVDRGRDGARAAHRRGRRLDPGGAGHGGHGRRRRLERQGGPVRGRRGERRALAVDGGRPRRLRILRRPVRPRRPPAPTRWPLARATPPGTAARARP